MNLLHFNRSYLPCSLFHVSICPFIYLFIYLYYWNSFLRVGNICLSLYIPANPPPLAYILLQTLSLFCIYICIFIYKYIVKIYIPNLLGMISYIFISTILILFRHIYFSCYIHLVRWGTRCFSSKQSWLNNYKDRFTFLDIYIFINIKMFFHF